LEVSVLECILGGLHIAVDVEPEPERACAKLKKSKVDAIIVDSDLEGTQEFLRAFRENVFQNTVPLVIISGFNGKRKFADADGTFLFRKPISVEQAVHTLSAARHMIMNGRLRYHRMLLQVPVSINCGSKKSMPASLTNLSQGGAAIHAGHSLTPGGKVKVKFELPGTSLSMRFQGEVAWNDKQGNAGIRFLENSSRARRDLQIWIERQYLSN
ncbi:MAG: PilZ domain-containing protein, partial [Acidobacteriales bacterium]|nr:PilZ domain-containing protein [Terriglobales bacterium]